MKNLTVLFASVLFLFLGGCGPASEDREKMHSRAKVFQDSIATFIRQSMQEAEMPVNTAVQIDTAAARRNAQAAPASTAK